MKKLIPTILLAFTIVIGDAQTKEKQSPHFNKDSTKFWWCAKCDTIEAREGWKINVNGSVTSEYNPLYKLKTSEEIIDSLYIATNYLLIIQNLKDDVKHYYHYYEDYKALRDSLKKVNSFFGLTTFPVVRDKPFTVDSNARVNNNGYNNISGGFEIIKDTTICYFQIIKGITKGVLMGEWVKGWIVKPKYDRTIFITTPDMDNKQYEPFYLFSDKKTRVKEKVINHY